MQTVQIDINDKKLRIFLDIIKNLKSGIVENIRTQDEILDIESIAFSSEDYVEVETIKEQNNKKYTLEEAKKILKI